MGNLASHPTLMLTPPNVIAARSTGGLLTPPSPMPQKLQPPPQTLQQMNPMPNLVNSVSSADSCNRLDNTLLAVCSVDMLSSASSAMNSAAEQPSNASEQSSRVAAAPIPPVPVQDATMQTDTPVCSDEENTQDTAMSECSAGVGNRGQMEEEEVGRSEHRMEEVCHSNEGHLDKECQATETSRSIAVGGRVEQVVVQHSQHQQQEQPATETVEPESKVRRDPVDLSGLELLSNSIEAFETIKREAVPLAKVEVPVALPTDNKRVDTRKLHLIN